MINAALTGYPRIDLDLLCETRTQLPHKRKSTFLTPPKYSPISYLGRMVSLLPAVLVYSGCCCRDLDQLNPATQSAGKNLNP